MGYWHAHLAQALLGERRFEETVAAANEALAVLRASAAVKSSHTIVNTQTRLMQALFGLERWAEADRLATEMRAATVDDPTARTMVDNPILQAFLHLKNGRLAQARERIDGAVRYRQRWYGDKVAATTEARAVRALVLQAQGEARLALEDYRAVFAYVFAPENTFGDAQPPGVREFFLPQALRGFLALVRDRHAKEGGKVDEELVDLAFRVADRLQLSTVQRALIDSAARVRASTPELGDPCPPGAGAAHQGPGNDDTTQRGLWKSTSASCKRRRRDRRRGKLRKRMRRSLRRRRRRNANAPERVWLR